MAADAIISIDAGGSEQPWSAFNVCFSLLLVNKRNRMFAVSTRERPANIDTALSLQKKTRECRSTLRANRKAFTRRSHAKQRSLWRHNDLRVKSTCSRHTTAFPAFFGTKRRSTAEDRRIERCEMAAALIHYLSPAAFLFASSYSCGRLKLSLFKLRRVRRKAADARIIAAEWLNGR